jgi:hypothetical protein
MSRTDFRSSDGAFTNSATVAYLGTQRGGVLKYVPGFVFILALFIAGKFIFPDPRATLVEWGEYHLSWVEVLMVGAAIMALFEQMRVRSWGSRCKAPRYLQQHRVPYAYFNKHV